MLVPGVVGHGLLAVAAKAALDGLHAAFGGAVGLGVVGRRSAVVDEALAQHGLEFSLELVALVGDYHGAGSEPAKHSMFKAVAGVFGVLGDQRLQDNDLGVVLDAHHDVLAASLGLRERACQVTAPGVEHPLDR